jgi:two-component system OmpR family sensor kinase
MQLARAEGGSILSDAAQDLRPVLQMVVEDIRRAERSSVLRLTLPEQAVHSRMDPDAFAILARNLIENAIRHGTTAEAIQVALSSEGRLSVTNHGPVVAADKLSRLIQPFERGATTARGSGLGLAIANAIAQAAGARLTLRSPAPGMTDGFEALVENLKDSESHSDPAT